MKPSYFLCFAFIVCLFACKKDDLPSPSQTGADTFGCKINGKSWIPNGGNGWSGIEPIFGGYVDTSIAPTHNGVFIHTYRSDNSSIDIYLQNVNTTGVYQLKYNTGIRYGTLNPLNYAAYFPGNGKAYVTTPEYQGTVTITRADTVNYIIS
ncbi:hypothetical protein QNI19_31835, partial [Cytophagaceae bacterium DM2B3-1]